MNLDLYKKAEKFAVEMFEKAGKPTDAYHAKRTAYWVRELNPGADQALLIAGLLHDIERAFYGDWKAGSDNPQKLEKHQRLSAKEAERFLKQEKTNDEFIKRVVDLILHHEEGGSEDQNVLCDADCIAYFEEKAVRNAKKYKRQGREEKMKKKLEYVYSRITSPKAKQIVKKWYQEALNILNH